MHVDEFTKQKGREALALEMSKEGMFELQKKTIRGNEYNVFVNVPQNLYEYFQFALIHGEWEFLAYEDESYKYQEVLNNAAGLAHVLVDKYGLKKRGCRSFFNEELSRVDLQLHGCDLYRMCGSSA